LKQPGDEVTLDILRDGKEEKVKVTLGKMNG
jgi:S1-C subfamily serine protease